MTNPWLKIIFLLTSMAAFWCFAADNFLAPEKPAGRRSVQQMKQELVELMADIIEGESALIEKRASIQQVLCAQMRSYARGDKKSFIGGASMGDVQKVVKLLRNEKARLVKEKNFVDQLSREMRTFLNT